MEVLWQYSEYPDVSNLGVSIQCILLTNMGKFATGYWVSSKHIWEVESLLVHEEKIVAWLSGLNYGTHKS